MGMPGEQNFLGSVEDVNTLAMEEIMKATGRTQRRSAVPDAPIGSSARPGMTVPPTTYGGPSPYRGTGYRYDAVTPSGMVNTRGSLEPVRKRGGSRWIGLAAHAAYTGALPAVSGKVWPRWVVIVVGVLGSALIMWLGYELVQEAKRVGISDEALRWIGGIR